MSAYYNDNDAYVAQWLRNLIAKGLIADGVVDERSIKDVRADELRAFAQCHFFAGVGGWSIALRLAGWPDDRPVWTGSCPCQPFSSAGAGKAADDSRHLWPAWFPLIAECKPPVVFGEQVEAAIGWGWLDAVFADLENEGYACGATILPACGVGAPHIRQRCWFVADSDGGNVSNGQLQRSGEYGQRAQNGSVGVALGDTNSARSQGRGLQSGQRAGECAAGPTGAFGNVANAESRGQREFWDASRSRSGGHADGGVGSGSVADSASPRRQDAREHECGSSSYPARPPEHGELGDATGKGLPQRTGRTILGGQTCGEPERSSYVGSMADPECDGRRTDEPWRRSKRREAGWWVDTEWLVCTDGKSRPTQPGLQPLAHGVQRRTSKLRAYGNAIVPQVASEFVSAFMECGA